MGVCDFSPTALRNLDQIATFLDSHNPLVTDGVIEKLTRTCQRLADDIPRGGRARPELRGRRTRTWPVPPYVIHYRPTRTGIFVTRIRDGRQDLRPLVRNK